MVIRRVYIYMKNKAAHEEKKQKKRKMEEARRDRISLRLVSWIVRK